MYFRKRTSVLFTLISLFFVLSYSSYGQKIKYETRKDIQYYAQEVNDTNQYISERCILDVYYPTNKKNFATIIWFHGGGLTSGYKQIPGALMDNGMAVIGVNYRLYPKVNAPTYIQDAAAAVAWVFNNIEDFGGDSSKIFLSGHSAGGYLVSMVGLDKDYLAAHNIDANRIAGLLPLSGHTITHFTVRKERGIVGTQPIIDSLAPLYHVRNDAPLLVLITGDRELELLGRYEENAYMYRMMKVVGHSQTYLHEIKNIGHGMAHLAFPMVIEYVQQILRKEEETD